MSITQMQLKPLISSLECELGALDFSLCKTVNLSSYQMHSKISDVFSFNAKEI